MGNLCSVVRHVFGYALSYVLPRYTPYFHDSYMCMLDESFPSFEDADNVLEHSFRNGDELSSMESQNYERDNEETPVNNIELLKDIISNFFSNYNSQKKVVNGKVFEKNFINAKDSFGYEQMRWNFRQENLNPGLEQVRVNGVSVDPKGEEREGIPYICNQNQENNPQEYNDRFESLVKVHETQESKKISPRDRRRKYGTTQKIETLTQRRQLPQSLSDSRSIVKRKNSADQNRHSGHNLRKLSLPQLHSGCHFLLEESNEDVKLSNYSFESVPLRIHINSFRSLSHPNLQSGGRVSYEELSEHLCVPNYYEENPIVYNEVLEGVEFPTSQPMDVPLQQASLRPTSCSGGGIVRDCSRKVSLPDIFPDRNPLLHSVLPELNTQSSASSGHLVSTEEEQRLIFSDMIFQSRMWDVRSPTQVVEREEDPNKVKQENSSPGV